MNLEFADRHPATQEKLRWLTPNPNLPAGLPADIAHHFHMHGTRMVRMLNDGPQLTIALQHLVDAKDAAVRQAIADSEAT